MSESQQTIPLSGTLLLPDGNTAPAILCLSDERVFLTTAQHGEVTIDLGSASQATTQYISRSLGDRLVVGGQQLGIPFGKAAFVRDAIARARLLHSLGLRNPSPVSLEGPFIDRQGTLEALWLAATLTPTEPAIAWLATQSLHTFDASIGGSRVSGTQHLLLTTDRTMLVAVSAFGDVHVQELAVGPLTITDNRLSWDEASLGDVRWTLPRGGDDRLRPLLRLPALTRRARIQEAARLLTLHAHPASSAQAAALLSAIQDPDPLDQLSLFQTTGEASDADLSAALHALSVQDSDAGRLAEWARRWELPPDRAQRLMGLLMAQLDADHAPWGLPLHRHVREQQLTGNSDLFEQAAVDMAFSTHLLVAGRKAEARSILEPRREKLPSEDLLAVLPPPDADLTSGEGGQPMHIQILELLAAARGSDEAPDPEALAELARHQPLVQGRLHALTKVNDPILSVRAEEVLTLLRPGGLRDPADTTVPPVSTGFDDAHLTLLQHPAAREDGILGRLQSALAKVTPPDHSTIQAYCERVSPRHHPGLIDAVADACVALGLPAVPTFISRGEKRVGVRSYEVPEPFLLIGGAHLDPEDDAYLRPLELRAAVAAEITHIRFQHSRITSNDLWAGVWDKGTTALETTAMMLPFLKFIPVDLIGKQKTYEMVSRLVPLTWLQRIYETDDLINLTDAVTSDIGKIGNIAGTKVGDVKDRLSTVENVADRLLPSQKAKKQDVSLDGTQILAAHRLMQITADRAALVLTGNLSATIRTLFLLHSRLQPELSIAERAGLHGCLSRKDRTGTPILSDVTIRTAALIAFYLSDDYTKLRANITPDEE